MKLTKSMLNAQIHLVQGNRKLIGNFLNFAIPAIKTCGYRTAACEYVCYAASEEWRPTVRKSRGENYQESLKDTFVADMIQHLEYQLNRRKWRGKIINIRIHTSGDYYNKAYYNKWVAIANYFKDEPRLTFQAYTKCLPYLEGQEDININFMYSIMPDTKSENIAAAEDMDLRTFRAVPIGKIPVNEFKCPGSCGPCSVCYDKDSSIQNVYTEYHGNRAKKASK